VSPIALLNAQIAVPVNFEEKCAGVTMFCSDDVRSDSCILFNNHYWLRINK
jgi:hypothetical protein